MDGHDFQFKEFQIAESIGLSFHGFNFVVGSFQRACGDMIEMILKTAVEESRMGCKMKERG